MDFVAGTVADIFEKLDRQDAHPGWRERLSADHSHKPVERVELDSGQVFYVEQVASGATETPVAFLPSRARR